MLDVGEITISGMELILTLEMAIQSKLQFLKEKKSTFLKLVEQFWKILALFAKLRAKKKRRKKLSTWISWRISN